MAIIHMGPQLADLWIAVYLFLYSTMNIQKMQYTATVYSIQYTYIQSYSHVNVYKENDVFQKACHKLKALFRL